MKQPHYRGSQKLGSQATFRRRGRATAGAIRSLDDVARILGVTRQAVSQVEHAAFGKIRRSLLPYLAELNPELHERLTAMIQEEQQCKG